MIIDPILDNAKERDLERLIQNRTMPSEATSLILKFSSDIGAIRNCGRRGSNFAPNALLSVVKKLAKHTSNSWAEIDIADSELEELSFEHAQDEYRKRLETILVSYTKAQSFIYLGGGHDHIYPSLMALNLKFKKIVVINIDAHLDTRTDTFHHSGTPLDSSLKPFKANFNLFNWAFTIFQIQNQR
jgi:formiminoglutamase